MRVWILCLAISAVSPAALAGEPTVEARAQQQLEVGYAHFDASRFIEAARAFEAAQALVQAPLNVRNIARCYDLGGRPSDALRWYGKHISGGAKIERRQRSERDRAALLERAFGHVEINCSVGSAQVSIDGAGPPVSCPARIGPLLAGPFTVRVEAPGTAAIRQSVEVLAGRTARVDAVLVPLAAPPRPAPRSNALGWTLLGTGAALVATGAVFHLSNRSAFTRLEADPSDQGLRDEVDRSAALTLAGYGLGAALLGGGAAVFDWSGEPLSSSAGSAAGRGGWTLSF